MTLLALALLGTPAASAGPIPTANYELNLPNDYNLEIKDYVFPSGLRIMFQEEHTQPVVAVTSVINHGAGSDPETNKGIAHFVEHLCFRAQHGDLPKNWDLIEQLGGSKNAFTSADLTVYLTSAPRDSLVPLLRIEALRLADTLAGVEEEALHVEREVVRNELRENTENAGNDAWHDLHRMLFPPGHPYHITVIGTHEGLDNSDLEAARKFTENFYRPEETTIVVVGDFELEETGEFIQQAFGDLPELIVDPDDPDAVMGMSDPTVRITEERPPVPDPVEHGPVTVEGMVDRTTVVTAWSLPAGYRDDFLNMTLAGTLLNFSVRQQILREYDPMKDDPPENIGCFYIGYTRASVAMCFAEPQKGMSPEKTIDEIGDALYNVWRPLDVNDSIGRQYEDWYLNYTRNDYMAGVLRSADEVANIFGGRSASLAQYAHHMGSAMYFSDSFNRLQNADMDAAKEIAREYFTRDRMVSVIVEPLSDEEKARRTAMINEDSDTHDYHGNVQQHEENLVFDLESLTEERIADLVIVPDTSIMRAFELDNGMDVVVVPYGDVPVVRAGLFVNGSSMTSDPMGLDALAESITEKGFRRDHTWDISRAAGAQYEDLLEQGRQLWAEGSVGNLDAVLHTLRVEVDQLRFLPAEKKMAVRNARKAMLRNSKKPEDWVSRVRLERLFPDHPLGVWFDDAHYQARSGWDLEMIKSWMWTKYQPANAQLVVVGRVDPDIAEAAVRRMFDGWQANPNAGEPPKGALPPPAGTPERQILLFDKEGVNQSEVILMCQGNPVGQHELATLQVAGSLLSERAWDILREQEGLTYGAYAYSDYWPGGPSFFGGRGLVQSGTVGFATDALIKLFEETATGNINPESLASVKWTRARGYVLGHQSGSDMLQRVQGTLATGAGLDFFDTYPGELAAVDTGAIVELMSPCVGHEIITIVGPVEPAKAQLEEYGYSYEEVDWETMYQAQLDKKELKKYLKAKAEKEAEEAGD